MVKPCQFVLTSFLFLLIVLLWACSPSGTGGLFSKKSPHELYSQKLAEFGFNKTALGQAWFAAAQKSLHNPLPVTIPYREKGYFPAEKAQASGLRFHAKQGEKLTISLEKRPLDNFAIYMELWQMDPSSQKINRVAYADTTGNPIRFDVENESNYVLTLQPELLRSGEYTLSISVGPSLGFPLNKASRSMIQSYFGDGRDDNIRKHEGIDIFSKFRTPVIAASDGHVTSVSTNNLGGKVVFMRPKNKDYTLYYAHLDSQMVTDGQVVALGDTLGLMGNTGNARTTPPHLHFGIYTYGGAVNPLAFVDPVIREPSKITASEKNIGDTLRTVRASSVYASAETRSQKLLNLPVNSVITVEAATSDWYKVSLPNGLGGFVSSGTTASARSSIKKYTLKSAGLLLEAPDSLAIRKAALPSGSELDVIGRFGRFSLVRKDEQTGWIVINQ